MVLSRGAKVNGGKSSPSSVAEQSSTDRDVPLIDSIQSGRSADGNGYRIRENGRSLRCRQPILLLQDLPANEATDAFAAERLSLRLAVACGNRMLVVIGQHGN